MTEQSNNPSLAESISALADNEASPLELRRVLKATESDSEAKSTWSRYQLISAAMRRDLPAFDTGDLASRVSAAIAQEDVPKAAPSRAKPWLQNLGRVGVAASVALVAVMGVQQLSHDPVGGEMTADVEAMPADNETTQGATPGRSAVSLPAGYYAPNLPAARNASAETGYEPGPSGARQVMFVPRRESVPVPVEEIRAYFNQLIEEHSEHAALNGNQGVLPYARIVTDEED